MQQWCCGRGAKLRSTRAIFVLIGFLVLGGCAGVPSGERQCTVNWANFIKFNNIEYVAGPGVRDPTVSASDVGVEYARTTFKTSDEVCVLSYRTQNGHAAFLEPGTPVFTIKDVLPEARLAVFVADRWVVYEALRP